MISNITFTVALNQIVYETKRALVMMRKKRSL